MPATRVKLYKYPFRYCTAKVLGEIHGFKRRTLDRWISEEKEIGKTLPGRIQLSGTRSFIYDPIIFHDEFFVAKINGPVRNEYEKREHLLIINNYNKRKVQ